VGYKDTSSLYKIYDPETGKIMKVRDVKFDEEHFGIPGRESENIPRIKILSIGMNDDNKEIPSLFKKSDKRSKRK
jgi:hypothetical protein